MSSLRTGPQPYRQSPGPGVGATPPPPPPKPKSAQSPSPTPSTEAFENGQFGMSRQKSKFQFTEDLAIASASAASSVLFSSGIGAPPPAPPVVEPPVVSAPTVVSNAISTRSTPAGGGMDSNKGTPRYDEASGGRLKSSTLTGYTSSSGTALSKASSNGSAVGAATNGTNGTSGSYSNGSSLTGTGSGVSVGGISSTSTLPSGTNPLSYNSNAGNYRLASLDRLAQRQKLYENGSGGDSTSKRELFFKNESSPAPALVTSINSGGPPVPTKPEVPSIASKLDALRTHQSIPTHAHHAAEDNREKESKEKSKEKNEKENRRKELDGYVGFANLPNQVYRRAVRRGFDFTLMVVGGSGLGKSTLINSMFLADVYSAEYPGPSLRVKKTVQVETCKILLNENGVNLTLTIVDTPGFGDAVDNSNCWQPVMDYIENRYEDYLNAESRVNRKLLQDTRVHACLYFIAPSGHSLKPLDIELMKKLHDKVNIIPVLAKADTMTPEECTHFKKQVLNEIAQHKIKIYEFPDCDDEEENKLNKLMRERVPFAVVGSNTVLEVDGKKVRGRKYPWGTVVVENMEHCDFLPLRNMVVRTHLQDLKDVTNNVHYENFRCRKLAGLGPDGKPVKGFDKNPLAQMEEEKKNHDSKMKKMEQEMEQVFEMKVKERNQRLVDSDQELKNREDQMRRALEKLQREVEDRKKQFESEKFAWEQQNGMTFEELRRKNMEALTKEMVDGNKKPKKKGIF